MSLGYCGKRRHAEREAFRFRQRSQQRKYFLYQIRHAYGLPVYFYGPGLKLGEITVSEVTGFVVIATGPLAGAIDESADPIPVRIAGLASVLLDPDGLPVAAGFPRTGVPTPSALALLVVGLAAAAGRSFS